jgi:hypothetical protein
MAVLRKARVADRKKKNRRTRMLLGSAANAANLATVLDEGSERQCRHVKAKLAVIVAVGSADRTGGAGETAGAHAAPLSFR